MVSIILIALTSTAFVTIMSAAVTRAASRTAADDHEQIAAVLTAMAELKATFIDADTTNRQGLAHVVAAAGSQGCT